MKSDFRAGQGHRAGKGDKIPAMDMLRGKQKGRAIAVRTMYKQTVFDGSLSSLCVVRQMKSVEGITYYMARKVEHKYLVDQGCHADIETGRKFRVTQSGMSSGNWLLDESAPSNKDKPEF